MGRSIWEVEVPVNMLLNRIMGYAGSAPGGGEGRQAAAEAWRE